MSLHRPSAASAGWRTSVALVASLLAMLPASTRAQDYPTHPIRVIVPFSPAARWTGRCASSRRSSASAWTKQ